MNIEVAVLKSMSRKFDRQCQQGAFSVDRDTNEITEAASSAKQDLSDDNRLEGNRRLEEETTRVQ